MPTPERPPTDNGTTPETGRGKTIYRRFDEMTWPAHGERLRDLSYRLRYGEPNKQDSMLAAGVLDAFMHLIVMPQRDRAEIIREIRKGPNV